MTNIHQSSDLCKEWGSLTNLDSIGPSIYWFVSIRPLSLSLRDQIAADLDLTHASIHLSIVEAFLLIFKGSPEFHSNKPSAIHIISISKPRPGSSLAVTKCLCRSEILLQYQFEVGQIHNLSLVFPSPWYIFHPDRRVDSSLSKEGCGTTNIELMRASICQSGLHFIFLYVS